MLDYYHTHRTHSSEAPSIPNTTNTKEKCVLPRNVLRHVLHPYARDMEWINRTNALVVPDDGLPSTNVCPCCLSVVRNEDVSDDNYIEEKYGERVDTGTSRHPTTMFSNIAAATHTMVNALRVIIRSYWLALDIDDVSRTWPYPTLLKCPNLYALNEDAQFVAFELLMIYSMLGLRVIEKTCGIEMLTVNKETRYYVNTEDCLSRNFTRQYNFPMNGEGERRKYYREEFELFYKVKSFGVCKGCVTGLMRWGTGLNDEAFNDYLKEVVSVKGRRTTKPIETPTPLCTGKISKKRITQRHVVVEGRFVETKVHREEHLNKMINLYNLGHLKKVIVMPVYTSPDQCLQHRNELLRLASGENRAMICGHCFSLMYGRPGRYRLSRNDIPPAVFASDFNRCSATYSDYTLCSLGIGKCEKCSSLVCGLCPSIITPHDATHMGMYDHLKKRHNITTTKDGGTMKYDFSSGTYVVKRAYTYDHDTQTLVKKKDAGVFVDRLLTRRLDRCMKAAKKNVKERLSWVTNVSNANKLYPYYLEELIGNINNVTAPFSIINQLAESVQNNERWGFKTRSERTPIASTFSFDCDTINGRYNDQRVQRCRISDRPSIAAIFWKSSHPSTKTAASQSKRKRDQENDSSDNDDEREGGKKQNCRHRDRIKVPVDVRILSMRNKLRQKVVKRMICSTPLHVLSVLTNGRDE